MVIFSSKLKETGANENMKKVEKIAINNAEKLMCEAAQRLSELAASEDEENLLVIDGQTDTPL